MTTARRVEERLVEVPLAITSISADELEAAQIMNLSDVAAMTPGFSYQNYFAQNLSVADDPRRVAGRHFRRPECARIRRRHLRVEQDRHQLQFPRCRAHRGSARPAAGLFRLPVVQRSRQLRHVQAVRGTGSPRRSDARQRRQTSRHRVGLGVHWSVTRCRGARRSCTTISRARMTIMRSTRTSAAPSTRPWPVRCISRPMRHFPRSGTSIIRTIRSTRRP